MYLSLKVLDVEYTELITSIFDYNSLSYIITCLIRIDGKSLEYQRQCFALSILLKTCPDLKKFTTKLFDKNVAPFEKLDIETPPPSKKSKSNESLSDLEIVKCCFNLLSVDPSFFKTFWNWSIFIKNYLYKGRGLQKLYTTQIMRLLNNIPFYQLEVLNSDITDDILIKFREESHSTLDIKDDIEETKVTESIFKLDVCNKMIVNIENVLLPIFDFENSANYDSEIVYTTSTKTNLRSIAMGITSGKAVCLTGPVGCGKTTLIEFMAGKTGRIPKKIKDIDSTIIRKRKLVNIDEEFENKCKSTNGFLRIQLGDQTEGKMLLGQYRCTDVPGEFIWLPGVLTQVSVFFFHYADLGSSSLLFTLIRFRFLK